MLYFFNLSGNQILCLVYVVRGLYLSYHCLIDLLSYLSYLDYLCTAYIACILVIV